MFIEMDIYQMNASWKRVTVYSLRICLFLLLVTVFSPPAGAAIGMEPADSPPDKLPAALDFNDIWFYDEQMNKLVPHIDPNWIMVVFSDDSAPTPTGGPPRDSKEAITGLANGLVASRNELIDWFYDKDLLDTGCFFSLRKGLSLKEIGFLIDELNGLSIIRYTHPVIRIKERPFVFTDALDIEWKTGVSNEMKQRILEQASVSMNPPPHPFRVNVFIIPFFKALNLVAEDIHVAKAAPRLIAFTPTLRAALSFRMHGGNIGDKLPFVFTIQFSDRVHIDTSSLANLDLRPTGIQKDLYELSMDPYDYVDVASRSPIRITGWLKLFTPGEAVIPPVKIKYTCSTCADPQVRTIETDPVALTISSIIPASQGESNLIVPMEVPDPPDDIGAYRKAGQPFLILSLTVFSLSLLSLGWLITILSRRGKQKRDSAVKSTLDITAEALGIFLRKRPSVPHWTYAADLGRLFRNYLVLKYPSPARGTGGGAEMFARAMESAAPAALGERIQQILTTVDDCVAEEMTDCPDIEAVRNDILNMVGPLDPY